MDQTSKSSIHCQLAASMAKGKSKDIFNLLILKESSHMKKVWLPQHTERLKIVGHTAPQKG